MEDSAAPAVYIWHFMSRLSSYSDELITPNAIVCAEHKRLPYSRQTRRLSYKVHDIEAFKAVFIEDRGTLPINEEARFAEYNMIHDQHLSMAEKIRAARERGRASFERREGQATSCSKLVISEGECRATREVELIIFPELYSSCK